MKKNYTLSFITLSILLCQSIITNAQVAINDSLALRDLYSSTHGNHWRIKTGWLTKKPVSEWYGITVSANRVTEIHLIDNNLDGRLPYSIGNLTNLTVINLGTNKLKGNIPASFANIATLTDLDLYNNQLSGHIPSELGNLPNLRYLYLFNNQLSGHIPPELGNLKFLEALGLEFNQLSGSIPARLGKLATLFYLYLNDNKLSGNIPAELGNLGKVNYLFLQDNELSGSIPSQLENLSNIYRISVARNHLSGTIPASFLNAGHLEELDLGGNKLTGPIPNNVNPEMIKLNIKNNYFSFDGMETLVQKDIEKLRYESQKKIRIHKNNNILSTYAGGTLSNNTYKWFKNGLLIATKNGDSTFTVSSNGNYNVEVTNSIATELTLHSDTIAFSTLTGFQQSNITTSTNNKINFSVYPNPATTTATISFNGSGNYTIKLADVSGNVLQTKTIVGNNKNAVQLNISQYAAGVYFVTISNEKNETQTLKLQKQ